ncbi:DUF4377 domain-containing protein [Acinetobacter defluvii]|uniref:DUF4377 domain-containing protein n=1 Tax=Acinetobacter defluvii TaxID=1871111 RepID=A0A2S2FFZ1_9GAMM|nr:META and DUF4377 domain-containing protein [Acinetobacter defluvii]AWL29705.1 DUF4377 domain-containing protein [Acinetobacter defluvii]
MKFKYLAIALFPFALAACQSSDLQKAGDIAVSILQQQNADKTLAAYQWSANTPNAPKPLVLNFSDKGQLSISTSCNGMNTTWKVENNQIITGNLAATQMACPANAMAQEGIAAQLFENGKTAFILNTSNTQSPTLTITSAKGEKFVFTGKMTPETQYQGQGETIFLEISPETKECSAGVMKKQCLQVREIKYAENGVKTQVDKDWTLFYDNIDGFTHRPNERQVVRLKRYEIKNPAADQSKYAYVQDMIIEREAIKGSL